MTQAIAAFIRANLPLTAIPFLPEIRIHKAVPASGLHRLAAQDESFASPYWAHYWGGGLALARYLLDHPEWVRGRIVLDLGTGSGLVAIAAALAGAKAVTGADIDPYAIAAAALNAEANGVAIATIHGDLTRSGPPPGVELVTVGDLFYEEATAAAVLPFLDLCAGAGAEILIGDPWRACLPHSRLDPIADYRISEASGAASADARRSSVFVLAR